MSAMYFKKIGFKLSTFSNPADTYMRILAVQYPKSEKDERKLAFFNECYNETMKGEVENENAMIKIPEPDLASMGSKNASFCTEVRELYVRNRKGVVRDPMQSKAKIFQQIIFSIIVAGMFH